MAEGRGASCRLGLEGGGQEGGGLRGRGARTFDRTGSPLWKENRYRSAANEETPAHPHHRSSTGGFEVGEDHQCPHSRLTLRKMVGTRLLGLVEPAADERRLGLGRLTVESRSDCHSVGSRDIHLRTCPDPFRHSHCLCSLALLEAEAVERGVAAEAGAGSGVAVVVVVVTVFAAGVAAAAVVVAARPVAPYM